MNVSSDPLIQIVPYDKEWPRNFATEAGRLASCLDIGRASIHHIGSTSVPGLAAKALIDVMIACSPLLDRTYYEERMTELGYTFRPVHENDRLFYEKKSRPRVHVHLVQAGSWHYWRLLLFRDRLRRDEELRDRYVELKMKLADAYATDRDSYSQSKTEFVTAVVLEEIKADPILQKKLLGRTR